MTTHEIRFRGRLVGHLTEDDARAHVQKHREGADNPDDWTIAPRKRWHLERGGVVLDTFDTEDEARTALERLAPSKVPHGLPAPAARVVDDTASPDDV